MTLTHFLLLAVASYRLTRIVTTDDWPPIQAFRNYIDDRTGPDSGWADLFSCPWCFGTYVAIAVFTFDHFFPIPDFPLLVLAAMTVIGYLGTWDSR